MNRNGRSGERKWVIAGLLVLALCSTALTGCNRSTVPNAGDGPTSGTVNSRFVDVDGLLTAPTRVVMSYPTEGLYWDLGAPQFLDGMIYTLSYKAGNENAWMTAWNQTTGERLWSVDTGLRWIWSFVSDGEHLFLHTANTFRCLDKMTGETFWESTPTPASPFVFDLSREIVLHINKQNNVADRLYVLGAETKTLDTGNEQHNPGIYILDGANGKLLGRMDWPALTLSSGRGELLCDGTTLYASMPESTKAEYPAQKSSLVAFDLTTNKVLWQESVDGEGGNLVKQGDMMVFIRSAAFIDDWIDVWQTDNTTASATRLWTRKIEEKQGAYHVFPFAVTNAFVYLQGEQGTLMALDLASGKEVWDHQFAPIKEPITEGPDMGKEHDTYQLMTMTTARDALYVQDGGGLLAVFDPASGKELWSKRISQVVQKQTYVAGAYVMQVVDEGIAVIMSNGT
ncbi:MAG TPA: PQQ-binding-like beta-propeller repeat protein, partial [Clostridia bacterium]|nr:PQQ-binding-like beta-propeller repeat protein [Clostridia bacterium]